MKTRGTEKLTVKSKIPTPQSRTSRPAGYSGTPLLKKIGIKPAHRIVLTNTPGGFREELGSLPRARRVIKDGSPEPADVIIFFAKNHGTLLAGLPKLKGRMALNGMLWAAWPKKASGVDSDLSEDLVRRAGLSHGLVDIKVCAINEVWSGLKFVIPLKERSKLAVGGSQ